jgi:hypothetical protein
MSDEAILVILTDIRNWTRAASFSSVKKLLEEALPDAKSRAAYQMLDGAATVMQIRVACKMSPNDVVALAQRCTSMGLMEARDDKKRVRLFDLADFGLIDTPLPSEERAKK